MYIKELDFYRDLIPGLVAAAVGYGVYFAILQTSYLGVVLPDIGDNIAYTDGLHFCCEEVYPYRNRKKV
jgi:hypothetical protein